MTLAMSGATPSDSGLASGLVNTSVQVGGAIGLAVLATLATERTDALRADGESTAAALNSGYHLAYLIGAALVAVAIVVAVDRAALGQPGGARRAPARPSTPTAGARSPRTPTRAEYDRRVPDRLYFTDSDEANALIASDPMALLVGFALDQQVTVQKAFSGPLVLRERLGALDAAHAGRGRPRAGLPRAPGDPPLPRRDGPARARRSPCTCATPTTATPRASGPTPPTRDALRANLAALPGFGEMKVKALGAVLAKRFGVEAAAGPRAVAPDARRRRLAAGARRLPGGQARPQGRVVEGPGGAGRDQPIRGEEPGDPAGVGRRAAARAHEALDVARRPAARAARSSLPTRRRERRRATCSRRALPRASGDAWPRPPASVSSSGASLRPSGRAPAASVGRIVSSGTCARGGSETANRHAAATSSGVQHLRAHLGAGRLGAAVEDRGVDDAGHDRGEAHARRCSSKAAPRANACTPALDAW